jgi:hypothetical protein
MTQTISTKQQEVFEGLLNDLNGGRSAINPDVGAEVELEYRIKLSANAIRDILVSMKDTWRDNYAIESSINILYDNARDSSHITKYTYNKNIQIGEELYEKTRKLRMKMENYDNIFLTVSTEKPITGKDGDALLAVLNSKEPRLIRIKHRIMIPAGIYRFDFTIVAEVPGRDISAVKGIRTELFSSGADEYESFISKIQKRYNAEMEVEINGPQTTADLSIESIFALIPSLHAIIESGCIIKKLAVLMKKAGNNARPTIKSLLSKSQTLSKEVYNTQIYPPVDYFITNKADGERTLAYFTDRVYIINSLETTVHSYTGLPGLTVIDCELVGSDLLGFDLLFHDGKDVTGARLEERLQILNTLNPKIEGIKYVTKQYFRLSSPELDGFKKIHSYKFSYPDDGFILSSNGTYDGTKHYKIKPHNTIDFLAIKIPSKLAKSADYPEKGGKSLYILFNGINGHAMRHLDMKPLAGYNTFFPPKTSIPNIRVAQQDYMPIQFSPADRPKSYMWYITPEVEKKIIIHRGENTEHPDWVIVELEPIFKDHKFEDWKFHKVRTDRINEPNYYGNDFLVSAQVNWQIAQDPLTIENMATPSESYFSSAKGEIYIPQTSMISFCKSKLIEEAAGRTPNKFVVDLAAGKGQDLARYLPLFSKGLFMDIDSIAISTLMARRVDLIRNPKYSALRMETFVGVEDLTQPKEEILARVSEYITPKKPGFINCNLAIHYLVYDDYHAKNFAGLVKEMIAPGGIFAYTTFNGAKINALLAGASEWVRRDGEVVKYKISKLYQGDALRMGAKIAVKLPFSGEEMYEEGLVDIDALNQIFSQFGLEVLREGSLTDYLPALKQENKKLFERLSPDDIEYVGLYHFCVLKNK